MWPPSHFNLVLQLGCEPRHCLTRDRFASVGHQIPVIFQFSISPCKSVASNLHARITARVDSAIPWKLLILSASLCRMTVSCPISFMTSPSTASRSAGVRAFPVSTKDAEIRLATVWAMTTTAFISFMIATSRAGAMTVAVAPKRPALTISFTAERATWAGRPGNTGGATEGTKIPISVGSGGRDRACDWVANPWGRKSLCFEDPSGRRPLVRRPFGKNFSVEDPERTATSLEERAQAPQPTAPRCTSFPQTEQAN